MLVIPVWAKVPDAARRAGAIAMETASGLASSSAEGATGSLHAAVPASSSIAMEIAVFIGSPFADGATDA
jgi:hypothetical protein